MVKLDKNKKLIEEKKENTFESKKINDELLKKQKNKEHSLKNNKNIIKPKLEFNEILKFEKSSNSLIKENNKIDSKIIKLKEDLKKHLDDLDKTEENISKKDQLNNKIEILEKEKKSKELKIQENSIIIEENRKKEKEKFLVLKGIKKSYKDNEVLKGIDIEIKKGDKVSIIGHNGSGKTTLSEIIAGIKKPNEGIIEYNFANNQKELGEKISIQLQKINYPEGYKVNEILNFFHNITNPQRKFSKERFKELIEIFGINKFYKNTLVSLSGGQQQRVNIFLTLLKQPDLLILDELSSGLDVDIYDKIIQLIKDLIKERNSTIIIVSHNLEEIKSLSDYCLVLKEGKIIKKINSKDLDEKTFFELIKRNSEKINYDFDFKLEENLESSYLKYFIEAFKKDYYFYKLQDLEKFNLYFEKKVSLLNKKNKTLEVLSQNNKKIKEEIKNSKEEKNKIILEKRTFKNIQKISKLQEKKFNIEDFLSFLIFNFKNKLIFKIKKLEEEIKKISLIDFSKEDTLNIEKIDFSKKEKKSKIDFYKENLEKINSIEKKSIEDKIIRKNEKDVLVSIRKIRKYYNFKPSLNNVTFDIKKGEKIAITGPNGSGKTTLTEIIATILDPTIGKINYSFSNTTSLAKHKIGMQFQDSKFSSELKVKEIIDLFYKVSKYHISKEDLDKLIKIFKLDKILNYNSDVISGGERQRINVLIAILKKPTLLILDEISTGLDIESIYDINDCIKYYLETNKSTLLLISHNAQEIHRLVDKVIVLEEGKIYKTYDIKGKSLDFVKDIFKEIYSKEHTKELQLNSKLKKMNKISLKSNIKKDLSNKKKDPKKTEKNTLEIKKTNSHKKTNDKNKDLKEEKK